MQCNRKEYLPLDQAGAVAGLRAGTLGRLQLVGRAQILLVVEDPVCARAGIILGCMMHAATRKALINTRRVK